MLLVMRACFEPICVPLAICVEKSPATGKFPRTNRTHTMTNRTPSFLAAFALLGAFCAPLKADLMDSTNAQHISFPDSRLTVNGLAWFDEDKPALRRLPLRSKDSFRPPVWSLAQQPSGGRIRFKTDSTKVGIRAQNPDTSGMHHMTTIGQSGVDSLPMLMAAKCCPASRPLGWSMAGIVTRLVFISARRDSNRTLEKH